MSRETQPWAWSAPGKVFWLWFSDLEMWAQLVAGTRDCGQPLLPLISPSRKDKQSLLGVGFQWEPGFHKGQAVLYLRVWLPVLY